MKMHPEYTAIIKQEGDCWVGWIEEVLGVNCQEETRKKLLDSLRVTLKEAIEFNQEDTLLP
jgi:predicted RNase H-like HicB family nuclease